MGHISVKWAIGTSRDSAEAAAAVRREVHAIDDRLPVESITTMRERVGGSVRKERLISRFCGFSGLLSLLLASIGLYGTMAYAVARRTGEIGVRMALGARPPDVLWMAMRESLILVALGFSCGVPLGIPGSPWIKQFSFRGQAPGSGQHGCRRCCWLEPQFRHLPAGPAGHACRSGYGFAIRVRWSRTDIRMGY